MANERVRLWYATIEHLRDGTSYKQLSQKYGVTVSKLRTSVYRQDSIGNLEMFAGTDYMTENWREVAVPPVYRETRGRKCRLTQEEESTVKKAAVQFQHDMTPLTRQCLRELVQHFITSQLSRERAREIGFKDNKPSLTWVYSFLGRHSELTLKSTRPVENKRVSAINPEVLASHFVRLETMCQKYNINDPRRVFNIDVTGVSVKELTEGRRYKAVCTNISNHQPISRGVLFKGSFDHVTVMPVVLAASDAYRPVVVVPGKRVPWKKIDGKTVLLNNVLAPGTLSYQREVASVDKEIFGNWVRHFIDETRQLRESENLLLVMDCFKGHIQYKSMQLMKDNGIVVCGLPSHSSHELQPLDKTVFNTFKAHLKNAFRAQVAAAPTGKIDIFGASRLITESYNKSVCRDIIVSGFSKTGVWNINKMGPDKCVVDSMTITSSSSGSPNNQSVTGSNSEGGSGDDDIQVVRKLNFNTLVSSFRRERRKLLSDGVVEKEGFVNIDSSKGINLTRDSVLHALKTKEQQRIDNSREKQKRAEERAFNQMERNKRNLERRERVQASKRQKLLRAELDHVGQVEGMVDERKDRFHVLKESRDKRRFIRRMRASMISNTER